MPIKIFQYGLYSSLCGGIIYVVFGRVPELNIAPTALLSLLTYSFTNRVTFGKVHAAILLCFLSGVVELLCGIVHLGKVALLQSSAAWMTYCTNFSSYNSLEHLAVQ